MHKIYTKNARNYEKTRKIAQNSQKLKNFDKKLTD